MPRFSVKDLIVATTLIGAGLATAFLTLGTPYEEFRVRFWFISLGLWIGGWAIVGAGAMYPFKKAEMGAWIGVAIATLILILV
jgi:hypothetical protein